MRTISLAEYKSIAKVGDNVKWLGNYGFVERVDDNGFNINGGWYSFTNWQKQTIDLLDSSTPDWRLGLAPIPREELRVGMTIKEGQNGTPHTITRIFGGVAYSNNEGFNAFSTDSSRAIVDLFFVPSPDTDWHALTSENVKKYLAPGDEIEYQWKDPANNLEHTESAKLTCINGEKIHVGGECAWLNLERCHHFRLIKKGTARSEAMPEVASADRFYVEETWVKTPIEELLKHAFSTNYTNPITKPTGHNKLMQVVTNLMKTVANSLLKDEDKAMRAQGFQNDNGADTDMFIDEVQARRLKADCDEFRAAITADVVKIWKEEQEKK